MSVCMCVKVMVFFFCFFFFVFFNCSFMSCVYYVSECVLLRTRYYFWGMLHFSDFLSFSFGLCMFLLLFSLIISVLCVMSIRNDYVPLFDFVLLLLLCVERLLGCYWDNIWWCMLMHPKVVRTNKQVGMNVYFLSSHLHVRHRSYVILSYLFLVVRSCCHKKGNVVL